MISATSRTNTASKWSCNLLAIAHRTSHIAHRTHTYINHNKWHRQSAVFHGISIIRGMPKWMWRRRQRTKKTHTLTRSHTQHFYIYWFKVLKPLTYIYRRTNSWFSRFWLGFLFVSFRLCCAFFSFCIFNLCSLGGPKARWLHHAGLCSNFSGSRTSRRNYRIGRETWTEWIERRACALIDHISGLKDWKMVDNSICTNARIPKYPHTRHGTKIFIFYCPQFINLSFALHCNACAIS